jgi:hypothetical protein
VCREERNVDSFIDSCVSRSSYQYSKPIAVLELALEENIMEWDLVIGPETSILVEAIFCCN